MSKEKPTLITADFALGEYVRVLVEPAHDMFPITLSCRGEKVGFSLVEARALMETLRLSVQACEKKGRVV